MSVLKAGNGPTLSVLYVLILSLLFYFILFYFDWKTDYNDLNTTHDEIAEILPKVIYGALGRQFPNKVVPYEYEEEKNIEVSSIIAHYAVSN